jgi:hypothetical protein
MKEYELWTVSTWALADDSQTACASQDYLDDKTFTDSISTELSVGLQPVRLQPVKLRQSLSAPVL